MHTWGFAVECVAGGGSEVEVAGIICAVEVQGLAGACTQTDARSLWRDAALLAAAESMETKTGTHCEKRYGKTRLLYFWLEFDVFVCFFGFFI